MARASLARCKCVSHGCCLNSLGYTEIPRSTQQQHHDDDLLHSLQQLSLRAFHQSTLEPDIPADNTSNSRNLSLHFKSILDEYKIRLQSFDLLAEIIEQMPVNACQGSAETADLQEHISWMTATLSNLKMMSVGNHDDYNQQREPIVQILQEKLKDIRRWEESRYDALRLEQQRDERNGDHDVFGYENEKYFKHPLSSLHPLILLSTLITVVLDVMNILPERSSNFLLQMHSDLLQLAFITCNGDRDFSNERSTLLKHLPKDIRTARSWFDLKAQIQVFAACPKCSALFHSKYDETEDLHTYPTLRCASKDIYGSDCKTALLKWRAHGKQTIRAPIRPFGYRSLHDFVGELLSRPGLEDLLERRPPETEPREMTDIFDGRVIREFRGRRGELLFRKNGVGTELYLAWAICVDWFNPFHNKAAGKSVSVGVIALVCLNLPLEVRNEMQNMYVAGIIPGPKEPSLEQVNNYLAPLIDDFLQSWMNGIRYTRTYKHSRGRTVVSILIPLVADLPASRKVSGTTGHNSTCFCPLCLRKINELQNFSVSFSKRDNNEHRRLAEEWRDAKTVSDRTSLAQDNGIRWSVLLNLPYWEPRFIAVDTMHNLLLGLTKHHFIDILGMKYGKSSEEKKAKARSSNAQTNQQPYTITAKKIKKIIEILKAPQGPTAKSLKRYTVEELRGFHGCLQIPLPHGDGPSKKDALILSLLCCDLVKSNSGANPKAGNQQMNDPTELDALPLWETGDAPNTATSAAGNLRTTRVAAGHTRATKSPSIQYISSHDMEVIQAAILKTFRPSWQQGPPSGFGTSQQGKLKADQWRTLLEFDLPVTLVELWVGSDDTCIDVRMKKNRLVLLDATMELAIALSWGISRRTSPTHAGKYLLHIQRYLELLKSLSPKPKLVPNHHSALHVGEQLLLFGPVQGWWTYPFERLIGTLQKFTTNYSIGEMELTMMKSYHSVAHLQRLLHADERPTVLRDPISKIEKHFPSHASGSYGSNVLSLQSDKQKGLLIEQLDKDIVDAIYSLTGESGSVPSRKFLVHKSHIVGGFKFTSLESEMDSIIFYGKGADRIPGFIRKIFSMADGTVLFAVHPYLKLDHNASNPFAQWPDFRASLWSQRVDEKVQLIDPKDTYICHAACRAWKDQEVYVLRAIDRNY